jgi:hypothetical protein
MAHAAGNPTRANARLHPESRVRTKNVEAGGALVLPVSPHFDLVISAARVELGLASSQFAHHQNRCSQQRLMRAKALWLSLNAERA